MKDTIITLGAIFAAIVFISLTHWVGIKKGEMASYDRCINYHAKLSVEDAKKICDKIVYGI